MEKELLVLHQEREQQVISLLSYQCLENKYEQQKEKLIHYKQQAHYWEAQFEKGDQKKQELIQEIEHLKAKLTKREQQLFGRKSEKKKSSSEISHITSTTRPRGQQRGSPGHGRQSHDKLDTVNEISDLADEEKKCLSCGLSYESLDFVEESELVVFNQVCHKINF